MKPFLKYFIPKLDKRKCEVFEFDEQLWDNNTNLGVKCRIKGEVKLKSKNAEIRLHSTVTEYMNKAFRF